MTVVERVHDVVEPLLTSLDLDLFDIEQAGPVVRVSVDRPGGVDLETLAKATRILSRELDEADPVPGRYTLEVTSPGLERKLKTPAHFRRSVGSDITVKLGPHVEDERRVSGLLTAADDDTVTVRTTDGDRVIGYDDIQKARTVFDWGPNPKPGTSGRAAGADGADDRKARS